ncbi:unnamed protein product [Malus baccata var. baccata]
MDLMEMGNEREKGSILLNQLYHQVYVFLFGTSNVSKIINHGSKHSPFALDRRLLLHLCASHSKGTAPSHLLLLHFWCSSSCGFLVLHLTP